MRFVLTFLALSLLVPTALASSHAQSESRAVRYEIGEANASGIRGSVLFTELDAATTAVVVSLSGTINGREYPARVYAGSCDAFGEPVLVLENVRGRTGLGRTTVDMAFDDILAMDAYLQIHRSPNTLSFIVACGEIGEGAEPTMARALDREPPVTDEPEVAAPAPAEPVTEEPVTEEPVVADPEPAEPVTEEPVTDEPVTEEPAEVEPVAEPEVEEPVVEEPEAPAVEEVAVTADSCLPYSSLPCEELLVAAPFALDWTGAHGGLADLGFTMVLPATNFTGSVPELPGLEAGNLRTEEGALVVTTTPGIKFGDNNDQSNALGVALDGTTAHSVETTVLGPVWPGAAFQQAGLWLGVSETDYVKLVVLSDANRDVRIQLLREEDGQSPNESAYRLESARFSVDANTEVRLRLAYDPATNAVTGTYWVDGTESELGTLEVSPHLLQGAGAVGGEATFAGVFATHRAADEPLDVRFGGFRVD